MIIKKEGVYLLLKQIPSGKVTTYKALANLLHTKGYRAIGQIVKNNPFAPIVPCHRVVRSDGSLGGYMGQISGPLIQKKKKLLLHEGVVCEGNKIRDFKKVFTDLK